MNDHPETGDPVRDALVLAEKAEASLMAYRSWGRSKELAALVQPLIAALRTLQASASPPQGGVVTDAMVEAAAKAMCPHVWEDLPDQYGERGRGWLDNGWENKAAWRGRALIALKAALAAQGRGT